MICPKCNKQYAEDEKFCSKCGVELIEEKAEEIVKKCPNCGREFDEEASFCPKCGSELISGNADSEEVPDEQIPEIEEVAEPVEAVETEEIEEIEQVTEAAETTKFVQEDDEPKSKTKWIVLGVCLIVVLIIFLVWYTSPKRNFKKYLEEDNFDKASYYSLKIDDLETVKKVVEEKAQKAYEDYNRGLIQYDDAVNIISELINIYGTEKVYEWEKRLDELFESKISFLNGEDAEENGDKLAAIEEYSKVSDRDKKYDTAWERIRQLTEEYKQDILTQAENLGNAGSYQEAILLLEEAEYVIGGDDDITAAIEEYRGRLEQNVSEEVLAVAQEYADTGDYASAILTLSNVTAANSEVTAKLAEYTTIYREEIITTATSYAESGEYEQAVDCLQDAIAVLGSDTEIEEKISEYEAKYPVHLCDLTPISGDNFATEKALEDIYGNKFERGLALYASEFEYVADAKYSRLQTTIMIQDKMDDEAKLFVKIYADDRLIYDSGTLTYKTRPIDVDLDISGVNFVRFEVNYFDLPYYWYHPEANVLISDPVFIS